MPDPQALTDILDELAREGAAHDAQQTEHRTKRLNLEVETARLVSMLIAASQRKRVLEIGTSNGYSALWIGAALSRIPNAQPLITVEREPEKMRQAQGNFARAGLTDWVECRLGDATEIVASLSGPFDTVFFDADRISAPAQLQRLLPQLEPDVLLLADNALSHPEEISGYLDAVNSLPGFSSMVIPIGKGLHIAHRPR